MGRGGKRLPSQWCSPVPIRDPRRLLCSMHHFPSSWHMPLRAADGVSFVGDLRGYQNRGSAQGVSKTRYPCSPSPGHLSTDKDSGPNLAPESSHLHIAYGGHRPGVMWSVPQAPLLHHLLRIFPGRTGRASQRLAAVSSPLAEGVETVVTGFFEPCVGYGGVLRIAPRSILKYSGRG